MVVDAIFLYLCICIKLLCYLGKLLRFPRNLAFTLKIFVMEVIWGGRKKRIWVLSRMWSCLGERNTFVNANVLWENVNCLKENAHFAGGCKVSWGGCNTFAREWYFCEQAKVSQGVKYFCERTQVICERTQMFCKFLGERHYFCEKIQVFCERMQ